MRLFRISLVSALLTVCAQSVHARETPRIGRQPSAVGTVPAPDSAPTDAEKVERSPGQHHGFYLRTELGGGYRSMSTDVAGQALRVDGAGVGASVLVGGTPMPNLVLLGEFAVSSIVNPTIHLGDQSADTEDASAVLVGFGPGLVYYVMPANLSLGATLLLTRLAVTQKGQTLGRSEMGFGGALRLGKEWQVSSQTGIGLGAQCTLASMKDQGEGAPTWFATAFTLGATFTFN